MVCTEARARIVELTDYLLVFKATQRKVVISEPGYHYGRCISAGKSLTSCSGTSLADTYTK